MFGRVGLSLRIKKPASLWGSNGKGDIRLSILSPNFSILSLQMTFSHVYEGIMENLQKTNEGHISSSQEDTETQRAFPKFLDIGDLLLLCIPRIQRHNRMVRRLGPRVR